MACNSFIPTAEVYEKERKLITVFLVQALTRNVVTDVICALHRGEKRDKEITKVA